MHNVAFAHRHLSFMGHCTHAKRQGYRHVVNGRALYLAEGSSVEEVRY